MMTEQQAEDLALEKVIEELADMVEKLLHVAKHPTSLPSITVMAMMSYTNMLMQTIHIRIDSIRKDMGRMKVALDESKLLSIMKNRSN